MTSTSSIAYCGPGKMKGAGTRGAVLLLVLLFVAVSVCADEASSRHHAEEVEGCCGLTGCAMVTVTIASASPTAIEMILPPVATSALPSPTRRPGLPPPEVASVQAA